SLELATKTRQPSQSAVKASVPGRSATRGRQLRVAAALIGVGVLLGAGLSVLGRRPSPSRESAWDSSPSWSGEGDLHLLPAPRRKEETVTRFTLKKGQPATILHLPKVIPDAGSPDEQFRLIVRGTSMAPVFDRSYSRSEMMRAFDSWGVMPILLPS